LADANFSEKLAAFKQDQQKKVIKKDAALQ